MKKIFLFLTLTLALNACFLIQIVSADDPKAREIIQKVEDRDDGDNSISDMEMILVDKNGKQRVRKITTFRKDKGKDDLSIMFFKHPIDVKDTGFLTHDFDDPKKDDDQWLYLPALKKSKRIASTDKSGSFMGSDLNYSDMTSRNLENYDFTFYEKGKETEINGVKVWVIQLVPRSKEIIDETGYKKSLLFIRQDNYFVIRAVNWEKRGGYVKFMKVNKLELIDGIWVSTDMNVQRKKGKRVVHQTLLKFHNTKFNQPIEENMFTVRRLEKGL